MTATTSNIQPMLSPPTPPTLGSEVDENHANVSVTLVGDDVDDATASPASPSDVNIKTIPNDEETDTPAAVNDNECIKKMRQEEASDKEVDNDNDNDELNATEKSIDEKIPDEPPHSRVDDTPTEDGISPSLLPSESPSPLAEAPLERKPSTASEITLTNTDIKPDDTPACCSPPCPSMPHPMSGEHPTPPSSPQMSPPVHISPLTPHPSSPTVVPQYPQSPTSQPQSQHQTNFMKYGSIRPPIAILQEEFLQTHHLWKEHLDPLKQLENMNVAPSSYLVDGGVITSSTAKTTTTTASTTTGLTSRITTRDGSENQTVGNNSNMDEWNSCMAKIQGLYSRYNLHFGSHDEQYPPQSQKQQQQQRHVHLNQPLHLTHNTQPDNVPSKELLQSIKEEIINLETNNEGEQKCEDSCDNTHEDSLLLHCENNDRASHVNVANLANIDDIIISNPSADNDSALMKSAHSSSPSSLVLLENNNNNNSNLQNIHHLVSILFRPGSKFCGAIEFSNSTPGSATNNTNAASTTTRESSIATTMADQMMHELRIFQDYELIIMEGDAIDELGINGKGIMARHKVAGDEQCVFIKMSYVPVDGLNGVGQEDFNSLTIQIEYSDGEHLCRGKWNHDNFRFEGTVKKITEGRAEPNPMGGTIISGLISGRSSGLDGGSSDESESERNNNTGNSNRGGRSSGKSEQLFTLSPCSHLHPRGLTPMTTWKVAEGLSRRHFSSQEENNDGESGEFNADKLDIGTTFIGFSTTSYKPKISPETRKSMLDEITSPENTKVILHRARTDSLRRETLMKLVELGSILDFADLARKRNAAIRREKWRKRFRKYTPRFPRRFSIRRGTRTSSTSSSISKDGQSVMQKKVVPFYDHLASIYWSDLLEEASVQTERTCAIFRRRMALLDGLTFESDEYKAQVMSDLRANGVSLANTHAEWDTCIQMGRTVALAWSWFERGSWGCFQRSAVVGKRCVYLLFQMHSRLESNHDKLEKAYRSADARITEAQLDKLTKRPTVAEDGDLVCAVCHCEMDEEENGEGDGNHAVFLPCSHCFHWDCIREWLHNHSQCPTCRLDLNPPGI